MTCKRAVVFILAILVILYSGCGDEHYFEEKSCPINISLAPRTQEDDTIALISRITRIRIIVEGSDLKTIIKDYPIENGKSEFSGTIDIPVGSDRKITVSAYDEEGNLIYEGTKMITGQDVFDVYADENPPVEIVLDPVEGKTVKLFPSLIEVGSGDSFTVDMIIKNFPNLFGITFRLEFDESYVKPVEVSAIGADKLLGNNVLFIDDIDQSSREHGTLNIGITSISESTEEEEGIIAEVEFSAIATGETTIKIDYDNLVWTEGSEFSPPKEPEEGKLESLKKYSENRGKTKVIIK